MLSSQMPNSKTPRFTGKIQLNQIKMSLKVFLKLTGRRQQPSTKNE
jgi:hypothetical protein